MELFQTSCEAGPCQPLLAPPFIPRAELAPLHKLCSLAFFWHEAGFKKEAGQLAHWLAPLEKFSTLWCSEKEYNEQELRKSFSEMAHIGKIPGWSPDFDVSIFPSAAFTISGNGTSLGMIRAGDVEIRAFGPQTSALQFGIKGEGSHGWTRCAALPEVWLEMKIDRFASEGRLDLRFAGLQTPIAFAFYIKAQTCSVGAETLKPKSLYRFNGEAKLVKLDQMTIESGSIHKAQVIPLAGGESFWGSTFLVSFEIHPLAPQASFYIHK